MLLRIPFFVLCSSSKIYREQLPSDKITLIQSSSLPISAETHRRLINVAATSAKNSGLFAPAQKTSRRRTVDVVASYYTAYVTLRRSTTTAGTSCPSSSSRFSSAPSGKAPETASGFPSTSQLRSYSESDSDIITPLIPFP